MNELIPTDWYVSTITQSYIQKRDSVDRLYLCFTIDRGEYSYRHVIREYTLNEQGINKLDSDFRKVNFVVYKKVDSELFVNQFLNPDLRVKIKVDRYIPTGQPIIKNIITEMGIPDVEREYNVKKPKSEDHFYAKNKGRRLPIWENSNFETIKKKQYKK